MPGVSLRALTRRYGNVAAIEDLSLDVAAGELVALLGPSGCGKTTTLRLVAGFLTPEAGEVWVGEQRLSSPEAVIPPDRRRMAMIFQSYALLPHMTVARNVAYGLRFQPGWRAPTGLHACAPCSVSCGSPATRTATLRSCRAGNSSG
jgi:iron(III) transport system ATP-binding protein